MNLSAESRMNLDKRLAEIERIADIDTPPMRALAQLWLIGVIRDVQPAIDALAFTQPENFELGKRIEALYDRLS